MDDAEALPLLYELVQWQGSEPFRYSHQWEANTLVMWDNRSVLHRATGGYDGHDRLLHRTTIAAWDGSGNPAARSTISRPCSPANPPRPRLNVNCFRDAAARPPPRQPAHDRRNNSAHPTTSPLLWTSYRPTPL